MSFAKDHRKFRGQFTESSSMSDAATFGRDHRRIDSITFRDRMKCVLIQAFGGAKQIAEAAGQSPRAAENQLGGLNGMRAHTLVNLMAQSEAVLSEVLIMAGRTDLVLTAEEYRRRRERAAAILAGEDEP